MSMRRRSLPLMLAVGSPMLAATLLSCGSSDSGDATFGSSSDNGGSNGSSSSSTGGIVILTDASSAGTGGASGSGGSSATGGGNGSATGNDCVPPTSLSLSPADSVATVSADGSFSQSYMVTAQYQDKPAADVTSSSFFTSSDGSLGSFDGNTFTWKGSQGGSTTISAMNCGVVETTTLTLQLSASFGAGGGGDGGTLDPSSAAGRFGSSQPSANASCNPTLVYPPDGILIPPNMNVMEVHFLPGANSLFEVSFSNAVTDVRIYTSCQGGTAAEGMPLNGGCVFELDQKEWDYIAQTNRNGDPVTVRVRGLGCDADPTKAGASAARQIAFAKEDLVGTLYYWASMRAIVVQGQTVNSGGVFRYDFGVRGQEPDPVLTPKSGANPTGLCIGCHDISRDGRMMIFDFDDNDDDDEYGDVRTDVYDIASAKALVPITKNASLAFEPGYHTWNRSHTEFLLSDGQHSVKPLSGAFTKVSEMAQNLGYTQPGTLRGTTPDWAPDDSSVVFAAAPNQKSNPPSPGFWGDKDLWFAGASIYTSAWDSAQGQLGAPTLLLQATGGDNYYYPSYSPDGSLIIFNHAQSGPNFHNPLARVELVSAGQPSPMPDDLARANGSPSDNPVPTTNSWARWSPFVQNYKDGKILWITMSSTRNYGLRIANDGKQNCYPTESPIDPAFAPEPSPGCSRTQLWMAAVKLDAAAVTAGTDVSFPAFWLPFQDLTTNNHLGQWAQQSFTGTCDDEAGTSCQQGYCCFSGGCAPCATVPPPATPPPSCAANVNCAPGQCCIGGACSACPAPDGGTNPVDGGLGSDDGGSDGGPPPSCNTCLDCGGQACVEGACGSCTSSTQCCAPFLCYRGRCSQVVK